MRVYFLQFLPIVFLLGCSSGNKKNTDSVNKIKVFEIGVVTKPIHELIFSMDSVVEPENLWYFNIVLSDSIFNEVKNISLTLSNDSSKFNSLEKPLYHGFEIDFYSENNTKIGEKLITDSAMFNYLNKINNILLINQIDSNTINKIKYVQQLIYK